MIPTPGPQSLMSMSSLSRGRKAAMPASEPSPTDQPEGLPNQPLRERRTPDAVRMLDWTNLDSAPSSIDVRRMTGTGGREGTARFAVLVNTPRMLRAASVFAEQAGLQGAQVRVFVDAKEALAWLYKDLPLAILDMEWPESHLTSELPAIDTRQDP
jgi:hypothetical protein